MARVTIDKRLKDAFSEIYEENPRNSIAKNLAELKELPERDIWENINLSFGSEDSIKIEFIPSDDFYLKRREMGFVVRKESLIKTEETRIGRFILRFLDTKNLGADDIENYTNLFRAKYDEKTNKSEFKIVDGKDINFWYDCDNYEPGGGTLNKSCMRNAGNRINAYALNPDKVKMLILVNGREKLIGRCILWKLDYPKGKIYADRIYTNRDSDKRRFESYIGKRGWLGYNTDSGKMVVVLDNTPGEEFPYLDTFHIYKKGYSSAYAISEPSILGTSNIDGLDECMELAGHKKFFDKLFKRKEQTFEHLKTFEQFNRKYNYQFLDR